LVFLDIGLPIPRPHDLLDCRQLYINTSHFHHTADEDHLDAAPSLIGYDCAVRTE